MTDDQKRDRKQANIPSLAALRRGVRGEAGEMDPAVALKQLIAREGARSGRLLREVAADPGRPSQLRATAAMALSQRSSPSHRETLLSLLDADPAEIVRRAAGALGYIGREEALERLGRMRPRDPVVKRAVDAARTLIAYRIGASSPRLSPPEESERISVKRMRTRPLEIERVSARELESRKERLEEELPELPVAERAYTVDCGRRRYLLVLNRALERSRGFERLQESSTMVGAVLERSDIDGHYHRFASVLAHPARGNAGHLFIMRDSGALLYYGQLSYEDEHARIGVSAVNTRGALPVDIDATLAGETLELDVERARVATQHSPVQPSPRSPRRIAREP